MSRCSTWNNKNYKVMNSFTYIIKEVIIKINHNVKLNHAAFLCCAGIVISNQHSDNI